MFYHKNTYRFVDVYRFVKPREVTFPFHYKIWWRSMINDKTIHNLPYPEKNEQPFKKI